MSLWFKPCSVTSKIVRAFRASVAKSCPAMPEFKSKDPLHGVTLEKLLTELVAEFGWAELARRIEIRCFMFDPSIKSSLTFLRKTPWARAKVEEMWVRWKQDSAD